MEIRKNIEKKIFTSFMVAAIECQGGNVFASEQPVVVPHVEGHETKKTTHEEFGEAYQLFENAIDETTDEELAEAGILGKDKGDKPAAAREALKDTLPLLWPGFGEKAWEMLKTKYAVAHYDILLNGGRVFFKIDGMERMKRFGQEEYDSFIYDFLDSVTELTAIHVTRELKEEEANCIVTLYRPESYQVPLLGIGERPIHSFAKRPGKIGLPVGFVIDSNAYSAEESNVQKFIRSHNLVHTAVHEFAHVVGLGHSDKKDDVMSRDGNEVQMEAVDNCTSVSPRNCLYLPRLKQYFVVSDSRDTEKSYSLKLIRWLRWQAMQGKLEGLLRKAEELAVKRH